MLELNP